MNKWSAEDELEAHLENARRELAAMNLLRVKLRVKLRQAEDVAANYRRALDQQWPSKFAALDVEEVMGGYRVRISTKAGIDTLIVARDQFVDKACLGSHGESDAGLPTSIRGSLLGEMGSVLMSSKQGALLLAMIQQSGRQGGDE